MVCRRGAHSKKLRSRVTKLRPGGQDLSLDFVRFARLFHGRCVMTPPRLDSRKDERSPARSALLRTGVSGWSRLIFNFSRRGAAIETTDDIAGVISADCQGFESPHMRGCKRERVFEIGVVLVLF
jgi:hypothetical protein